MHAVTLLASSLTELEAPTPKAESAGICCVTGEPQAAMARADILGKSFTNQAVLRAPMSPLIGIDAARVLRFGPARKGSWICDGETFTPLRRQAVRTRVLGGVTAPRWAGYITTSYKKHGALLAPVNTGGSQRWLFETEIADCSDRASIADAWERLRAMREAGWPRPVLEDLSPSPWLLGKLGPLGWLSFERWARPHFRGVTYRLLCYLLPSQEEIDGAEQD